MESLFCRQQGGTPRIRSYLKKKGMSIFAPEIYSQDVTVEPERRGAHVAEEGLGASIFDNLDFMSSSLNSITNR